MVEEETPLFSRAQSQWESDESLSWTNKPPRIEGLSEEVLHCLGLRWGAGGGFKERWF